MDFNVKKCKFMRVTKRKSRKVTHNYVMATASTSETQIHQATLDIAKNTLTLRNPPQGFSPLEEITADKYLGVYLDL